MKAGLNAGGSDDAGGFAGREECGAVSDLRPGGGGYDMMNACLCTALMVLDVPLASRDADCWCSRGAQVNFASACEVCAVIAESWRREQDDELDLGSEARPNSAMGGLL